MDEGCDCLRQPKRLSSAIDSRLSQRCEVAEHRRRPLLYFSHRDFHVKRGGGQVDRVARINSGMDVSLATRSRERGIRAIGHKGS